MLGVLLIFRQNHAIGPVDRGVVWEKTLVHVPFKGINMYQFLF